MRTLELYRDIAVDVDVEYRELMIEVAQIGGQNIRYPRYIFSRCPRLPVRRFGFPLFLHLIA